MDLIKPLKFKLFDEETSELVSVRGLRFEEGKLVEIDTENWCYFTEGREGLQLFKFTGEVDQDGKEIYERC